MGRGEAVAVAVGRKGRREDDFMLWTEALAML